VSTSQDTREAIATALRAVVPDTWSVLSAPPAGPEPVPSITVGPGAPYQQRRRTFKGEPNRNYRLTIIQQVVHAAALDTLDAVLAELLPIFDTMTTVFTWESVSTAGDLQTRGGKDVVVAYIPISV
jgi:hypothetical protein